MITNGKSNALVFKKYPFMKAYSSLVYKIHLRLKKSIRSIVFVYLDLVPSLYMLEKAGQILHLRILIFAALARPKILGVEVKKLEDIWLMRSNAQ